MLDLFLVQIEYISNKKEFKRVNIVVTYIAGANGMAVTENCLKDGDSLWKRRENILMDIKLKL